jgi:hypothetical protein
MLFTRRFGALAARRVVFPAPVEHEMEAELEQLVGAVEGPRDEDGTAA